MLRCSPCSLPDCSPARPRRSAAAGAGACGSIGEFEQPIYVTSEPGEPERLFVVEREGRVVEFEERRKAASSPNWPTWSTAATASAACSRSPCPRTSTRGRFYVAYTGKPAAGGAEGDVHVDAFAPRRAGTSIREADLLGRTLDQREPQRRPARVRPRRLPLHLDRRRRRRRRPVRKRPEPRRPARQDPPHRPASEPSRPTRSRPATRSPGRRPTRSGPTGCAIPGASPSTARPATW